MGEDIIRMKFKKREIEFEIVTNNADELQTLLKKAYDAALSSVLGVSRVGASGPIRASDLRRRAYLVLQDNGITTNEQLAAFTGLPSRDWRNCGRTSEKEFEDYLLRHGWEPRFGTDGYSRENH